MKLLRLCSAAVLRCKLSRVLIAGRLEATSSISPGPSALNHGVRPVTIRRRGAFKSLAVGNKKGV
jgi:hypothetical protein